ncbi:MAG: toxin HicA [Syntrophobacteraceae bacterium]
MSRIENILEEMERNPADIRFTDLCRVCDHYFGKPRQEGTSHRVYKMPWQGDPRVNIQNRNGKARAYQVRQVLKAVERLRDENVTGK